jgi:hypothetical protein
MPEQGSDILAHFGEDQFLHRLQIYKSHIAEWRQRYPKLIGVDLRYEGDVPLEMSNDNASATPATIPAIAARISSKPTPSAKPAAMTPIAPPKAVQAAAAKPTPSAAAVKTPVKTETAAHKAAEARRRAARLQAAKAKAAREKAATHKNHAPVHSAPAAAQPGQ